jgi:glycosyltransferase involved in cell wall biosynthesis
VPEELTFAIPFYKGHDFLTRTLASLLAQDDPSWQAVVCDDGDAAGTQALVEGFADPRLRYLKNPHNLGIGGNFNRGLDVAETELVTLLHADDELMPSYTRTMRAAAARHPDAAAFYCRAEIIDGASARAFSLADVVKDVLINPSRRTETILHGEPGLRALLSGNFIMAPTLCFRRRVLGARRFPAAYHFVLDWELTTTLLLDGETLIGLPDRCYRYRRHEAAQTSQHTKTQLRFREESEFYDRIRPKVAARGWDACVRVTTRKRMVKLNIMYGAVKHALRFKFGEARRGLRVLKMLDAKSSEAPPDPRPR